MPTDCPTCTALREALERTAAWMDEMAALWPESVSQRRVYQLCAERVRDALLAVASPAAQQDDLRAWTLDNIYTIARREMRRLERLADTSVEQERWGHVLRLCEKVGCQPRGMLRDNGGPPEASPAAPSPQEPKP